MAKEVVWTDIAVRDPFRIYQFWLSHNQSPTYSEKLERLFNESARLIAEFPEIGPITDYKDVRVKTVGNHKLFYRPSENKIEIIRVWDTRQNPDDVVMWMNSGMAVFTLSCVCNLIAPFVVLNFAQLKTDMHKSITVASMAKTWLLSSSSPCSST